MKRVIERKFNDAVARFDMTFWYRIGLYRGRAFVRIHTDVSCLDEKRLEKIKTYMSKKIAAKYFLFPPDVIIEKVDWTVQLFD